MKNKVDYILILLVVLIFFIGILNIYSAGYNFSHNYIAKQITWFFISILFGYCMYLIGARRLINMASLLYLFSVLLLIVVLFLPTEGTHRWIRLGFFNFQPSQVMKFSLPVFMVAMFYFREFHSTGAYFLPILTVIIPALLIAKEPDLGGALMLFPSLFAFFIFKKASLRKALPWIIIGVIMVPLLCFNLEPYQKRRLLTFTNPNLDPLGAGYTLLQSKIAIGSGRILGKGWLKGAQGQLRFLPESHTDFVFPVFAEEWGFIGAVVLLMLYYFLLRRMLSVVEEFKDDMIGVLLYMFLVIISVQLVLNIGMTMGLVPIVGLPLPLLSYGGSDLIITISMVALFFKKRKIR
ncbi:MAG: FtsW/RodA/SpoVE family cell cycle protein [Candidatus Saelkia tenebricola]|nr:FtsW/RodA/SpoVE family cell cycle protein [Candidatus Saelkia tenebricola]